MAAVCTIYITNLIYIFESHFYLIHYNIRACKIIMLLTFGVIKNM